MAIDKRWQHIMDEAVEVTITRKQAREIGDIGDRAITDDLINALDLAQGKAEDEASYLLIKIEPSEF